MGRPRALDPEREDHLHRLRDLGLTQAQMAAAIGCGRRTVQRVEANLRTAQGYSLAEIAERLGETKVVTAEHYLFAIGDYAEADYAAVLSR